MTHSISSLKLAMVGRGGSQSEHATNQGFSLVCLFFYFQEPVYRRTAALHSARGDTGVECAPLNFPDEFQLIVNSKVGAGVMDLNTHHIGYQNNLQINIKGVPCR